MRPGLGADHPLSIDQACALETVRSAGPDQVRSWEWGGVRTGGRREGLPAGGTTGPLVTDPADGSRLQSELAQGRKVDQKIEPAKGPSNNALSRRDHGTQDMEGGGQTFAPATALATVGSSRAPGRRHTLRRKAGEGALRGNL